jgi:hypothetical protein
MMGEQEGLIETDHEQMAAELTTRSAVQPSSTTCRR